MPISTDEVGQVLERRLFDLLSQIAREAIRSQQREKMVGNDIFAEAVRASRDDAPYVIAGCRDAGDAQKAVAEIRNACVEAGIEGAEKIKLIANDEYIAFPKSVASVALPALEEAKLPIVILSDSINPKTRAEDIVDPEWTSVALVDPQTGDALDPQLVEQVEGFIKDSGIEYALQENTLVFRNEDRGRVLDIMREHGREVPLEEAARETRENAIAPATEKQRAYINDLYAQDRITDAEMASFSLAGSKAAATELITKARARTAVEAVAMGPDIARDAQAAMRREDIGNVETTAEHVQARPNAGDQDRSTPYPDQCDPSGAGDKNGDGVRDAAQDRDGDGTPDPEDPDNIGEDTRTAQDLCEQKTAEAAYIDSMPKTRGADVSLQQESR